MYPDLSVSYSALGKWLLGAGIAVLLNWVAMIDGSAGQQSGTATPPPLPTIHADRQGQPSSDENMGQIDTQSGGAPASSPQGETPPGMQSPMT